MACSSNVNRCDGLNENETKYMNRNKDKWILNGSKEASLNKLDSKTPLWTLYVLQYLVEYSLKTIFRGLCLYRDQRNLKIFIELQFLNTYDIDKSLATNLSVIEAVIEIHSSNIVAHEY